MLEVKPFSQRERRYRELLTRGLQRNREDEKQAEEEIRRIREDGGAGLLDCVRASGASGMTMERLRVTEAELTGSRKAVPEQFLSSLCLARVNARKFHEHQRRHGYIVNDAEQVILSRCVRPLRRAGILCGESFSALLMHAAPAILAGVGSIAVAVRPRADGSVDPHVLAVCKVLGLEEVYRMSGAHAVAAFAYGAGPVARVDKIVGPGGPSAAAAKRLLAGLVGVDTRAGMSELAVIADNGANAKFIAGDFLAQAEQENLGLLALFCTDRMVAEAVRIEIDRLLELMPEASHIRNNLAARGALYHCPDLETALAAVNALAPARLGLQTSRNDDCLAEIDTAGAVFMGPWSTETAGGCFSGTNPALPDGGQARFASGLGVDDFVREMTVMEYGPDRLLRTGRHQACLAREENFPAQAEAVRERLEVLNLEKFS